MFSISSPFKPAGDQPSAIAQISERIRGGARDTVLLGVTGSGKTFTMAHVINELQRPALIMAHNKTLVGQLYNEMKEFFPNNRVEYFVSYYDYYQPEAYIAHSDLYIEKDAKINDQIDLLRHSATRSLIESDDVIVIASVSSIYGLGTPDWYLRMCFKITKGMNLDRDDLARKLIDLHYLRNDINFERGTFRMRGHVLDIFPSHYEDEAWRIEFWGSQVDAVKLLDPLTGSVRRKLDEVMIFPNTHYITSKDQVESMIKEIKQDLEVRVQELKDIDKIVEAHRLEQRTSFDIEMILSTGTCKGIENYSRYLSGKRPGEAPPTLFDYLPEDTLVFIDESHATVPQIRGMYNGDRARKQNLVEYGFRLPSALDNRPLRFDEWDKLRGQTVFVSATPGEFEMSLAGEDVVEQIIRPTGLVDPICEVRPAANQVDDLLNECQKGGKILITTLTKRMAENLAEYLEEINIKAVYLHSDIKTLERLQIIADLRGDKYDVLVGVNLLREGLDIPECTLVAILDADKEGFLRSTVSLIQTSGRAARNKDSKVIMYADTITNSMSDAISEMERRRNKQLEHNKEHNITPKTIKKHVVDYVLKRVKNIAVATETYAPEVDETLDREEQIKNLEKQMKVAATNLEFEEAAKIRDKIAELS